MSSPELRILFQGNANVGKSTTMAILAKALKDAGLDVEILCLDGGITEHWVNEWPADSLTENLKGMLSRDIKVKMIEQMCRPLPKGLDGIIKTQDRAADTLFTTVVVKP